MLERTPQAFMNSCISLLWNSGYSTSVNDDLHSWVDYYKSTNPHGVVNAAADPTYHHVGPDNSFWLAIYKRGTRDVIACIAQRMIESDDFVEMQRDLRVWYGEQASEKEPLKLAMPRSDYPEARGLIGHPAGLFVAQTERNSGLAWMLQRMARAYALTRWPDTAWQCGNTLEPVAARGLPINTYGYTRCDLLTDGWFEPTQLNQKVFITSINQQDMMLQIAGDLSLIEMNADKQVRDVVTAARERQSNAPVLARMAG